MSQARRIEVDARIILVELIGGRFDRERDGCPRRVVPARMTFTCEMLGPPRIAEPTLSELLGQVGRRCTLIIED
jgi:hypothetical protein